MDRSQSLTSAGFVSDNSSSLWTVPRRLWHGTPTYVPLFSVLLFLITSAVLAAPGFLPPGFEKAAAVQHSHNDELFRIDGVVGTAVGRSDGEAVVVVYTEHPGVSSVPATLDGVVVVNRTTGRFFAL